MQWNNEILRELNLISHCLLTGNLQLALLIIFIASEWVGMCTDNLRKHVLFCFYFLLFEETSFYWQKDVRVPERECCCELIMVRTFPIPCQFITPQGFLFKIFVKSDILLGSHANGFQNLSTPRLATGCGWTNTKPIMVRTFPI